VTWNSTIIPLPRFVAVTSGVPSASVAQVRSARPASGSASTWRRDVDVLRHRHIAERAFLREGGERLRLVPAQAAAEGAAAAAQLDRHQIVVRAGEAGAGETHQHAAVLDQAISRSRVSPETLPTSASMIIGTFCSTKRRTASAGDATSARRTSANGLSARER
jgi:hypothetical protein